MTKITPLKTSDFGLVQHKVKQFNAIVPGDFKTEDLENPEFWVHIAPQLEIGCEIRAVAEDMSFVAHLICTFAQGSSVRVKMVSGAELDQVDYEKLTAATSDYDIKLRGPRKWCIIKVSTGEIIKEYIPTQAEAATELRQYKQSMAA